MNSMIESKTLCLKDLNSYLKQHLIDAKLVYYRDKFDME